MVEAVEGREVMSEQLPDLHYFGLGIPLVEAVESQSEARAAESDVSRECERRTHPWPGQDGEGLDYEEEPPLDDSGGWREEYPDDHGHL